MARFRPSCAPLQAILAGLRKRSIRLVNDKQKPPSKKAERLAEALKRNIARRKAAKKAAEPKKN